MPDGRATPSVLVPTELPRLWHHTLGGVLVLANDRLSGTRLTVHAFVYLARSKRRRGTWERSMRNRAAIADQIDYWIRRHAIRARDPSRSKQKQIKSRS